MREIAGAFSTSHTRPRPRDEIGGMASAGNLPRAGKTDTFASSPSSRRSGKPREAKRQRLHKMADTIEQEAGRP